MQKRWLRLRSMLLGGLAALMGSAVVYAQSADWTEPFPAFKVAGNVYYVGSRGLANTSSPRRRDTSSSIATSRRTSP